MTVAWYDGATLEVSIAWSFPATSEPADINYTDISDDVRAVVSISRGRSSERDTFQAGSLSLTLDNRDRAYDPDYSAGPNFGVLLPMKHIRVRLTYSGSTSYLFKGFVQGWPQTWERSNNDGTVTIIAHDAFKMFARTRLPESAWAYEVESASVGNVQAWYRLGEVTGSELALDSSGSTGRDALYSGVSTESSALPELSTDGAQQVSTGDVTNTLPILYDAYAPATGTTFTVGFWIRVPGDAASGTQWLWLQANSRFNFDNAAGPGEAVPVAPSNPFMMFGLSATNQRFEYQCNDGTNASTGHSAAFNGTVGGFPDVFDGERHFVTLHRSGSTLGFYVDGVGYSWSSTTGSISAGSVNYGTKASVGLFRNGTWEMDEVLVYNSQITTGTATLYTAGSTAHAGETVDERIDRVITMTGVGVTTTLDASTITVRGCDFGGGFLLDYLQSMWATEGGQSRLFVAANGELTFHDRYHDTNAPAVITAFSDVAGSTLPYSEMLFDGIDDVRIYNDITVARTNSPTQRAFDQTSIDDYGTIGLSVSVQNQSDAECAAMARGLLYQYKDPRSRIRGLTIKPRSAPATLFPKVRTTEIGTRISARRLPVGVGSAWTKEQTVENVSHQFDVNGGWTTTYLTAPVDTAGVWWVLGDSTYGILGTARVGY